jgi:aspartyl-tRNA(Asn)/glutamyl-tRNA(Gln) amidotransferase subunit A
MPFNKLTLEESLEGLKSGKFTSLELTKACLEQIERFDKNIQAFITVTKDFAIKQAEEADKLISKEKDKSKDFIKKPLLGIPYACKDNFSTKGIQTTAGSNILKGYVPPFESKVTKKLKEAGAILLGKTNMDAFAHGSTTENSDFFKTKNPWNLNKVPGGSSGGSAAAVASDMCIFAIGSETAGSIRLPASWCGVTGLKPSYGRVSRYGVAAMASSTDSPGVLSKTVQDSALVLKIIAGKDTNDATSSHLSVDDYFTNLSNIEKHSIKKLKIGKPKSYFNLELEKGVKEKIEEAVEEYKKLGAQIIEIDLLDPKYSIAVYTILQRSEVSSNLGRYDGIRYGNDRTNFGFEAKKRVMLGTYTLSSGYYDAYYSKAQKVRTVIVEDFKKAFSDVDLIIGPTVPCVAMNFGESDKSSMFGELIDVLAEPSSIAGLCGINIPCGFVDNLPVGFQLLGPMGKEDLLLSSAGRYQEVTNYHKERPKL